MAAEVPLPTVRDVLDEDDEVRRVTEWAARQLAALDDLRAELTALRPVTAAAEPAALLGLVDDVLRAASERLAARTAEAIAEADDLVADAVARGTEVLVASGRPAAALRAKDPLAVIPLGHRAPRTAVELWRTTAASMAPAGAWRPPRHPDAGGGRR